jgi:hypothetical protein
MDMQKCSVCKREFDFDEEGLGCGDVIVCGNECAKKSSESRGNSCAIHDKKGEIVETNEDGTEDGHIYSIREKEE